MPRVSAKRQITLPIDQCREVGIGPGDEYRSFVADGRITIVRKTAGAARGFLRRVARDPAVATRSPLRTRWTSRRLDRHRHQRPASVFAAR